MRLREEGESERESQTARIVPIWKTTSALYERKSEVTLEAIAEFREREKSGMYLVRHSVGEYEFCDPNESVTPMETSRDPQLSFAFEFLEMWRWCDPSTHWDRLVELEKVKRRRKKERE